MIHCNWCDEKLAVGIVGTNQPKWHFQSAIPSAKMTFSVRYPISQNDISSPLSHQPKWHFKSDIPSAKMTFQVRYPISQNDISSPISDQLNCYSQSDKVVMKYYKGQTYVYIFSGGFFSLWWLSTKRIDSKRNVK